MGRGKNIYFKKLSMTLASATIATSVILLLAAVLLIRNLSVSRERVIVSTADAQAFNANLTFEFIKSAVDRLSTNENVQAWLDSSSGTPEYYLNSVKVFKEMSSTGPSADNLDYDISITRADAESFVITTDGTVSKEMFCQQNGIDMEEGPYFGQEILPVYDKNGMISDLMLVTNRFINGHTMVIFSKIPLKSIFSHRDYLEMAVYDRNRGKIISDSSDMVKNIEKDIDLLAVSSGNVKIGKYNLTVTQYPDIMVTLIYGFPSEHTAVTLLVILLFAVAVAALSTATYFMTKNLYSPVKEAVSRLNTGNSPVADEFNLILDNCRKIEQLNIDLEQARKEQKMLSEQQKYRAFIRGVPTETAIDDGSSYFSLCTASMAEDDGDADTLFAKMDMICKERPHLHTIRTSHGECVIIQKAPEKETSSALLVDTIRKSTSLFENAGQICFAIANPVYGYKGIPDAYGDSRKILGYRYKIRNKMILTSQDCQGEKTFMYYPLSEEGRLMNAILSNDEEALGIFDSIIDNNIGHGHDLPPEELGRFTFAITASTARVFQELKEEPESLIGEKIDWNALSEDPDHLATLGRIREILSKVCTATRKREEEDYDNIINKMKDYISTHYNENIMLIDLSNEFNLTPKYCSQIFKKLSNDTFKNYLNQYRTDVARRKIMENPEIKISDLSAEVGFTSSTSFIRVFSKYVGTTPKGFADIIIKRNNK